MIRQNLNSIVKRSIQNRRCVFQKQQATTQSQGSGIALSDGCHSSSFLLSSSSPRRVVSSTTKSKASASSPPVGATFRGNGSLSPGATTTAGSARRLLQRATPVFSKDAIRDALPIIGNGAYLALASGFLMTDMLQLRLMLVGGYAGLVTFHSLHAKPLQIPLRWSALFVVVNAGAAMLLFVDQWIGTLLSEEEMALYEEHFKTGLTPGQFYYLLKMSETQEIEDGSVLTTEGRVSPYLYFIEKGQAKVYHRGTFASYVDEGGFVNDVAFQRSDDDQNDDGSSSDYDRISRSTNGSGSSSNNSALHKTENNNSTNEPAGVGAYGTVIANGDCRVWVWDQVELKEYLKKNPAMDRNMKYTLSEHLVRSLLKQREVRRQASMEERDVLDNTELTMPQRTEFQRNKTSSWP